MQATPSHGSALKQGLRLEASALHRCLDLIYIS